MCEVFKRFQMRSNSFKCDFIHVFLVCTVRHIALFFIWPCRWISNRNINPYEKVKLLDPVQIGWFVFQYDSHVASYMRHHIETSSCESWCIFSSWKSFGYSSDFPLNGKMGAVHASGLCNLLSWRMYPCPITLLCLPGLDKVALLKSCYYKLSLTSAEGWFFPPCHFLNGITKMYSCTVLGELIAGLVSGPSRVMLWALSQF